MSNIVKFGRKPSPPAATKRRREGWPLPVRLGIPLVAVAGIAVAMIANRGPPEAAQQKAQATTPITFSMCGRERFTCVVDGDTIWLKGQNLRLQSYDTPEPYDGICGGAAEVALAKKASARLLQLLNGNPITVETFGLDNTGKRTLATVRINGRDVGDILIAEKLARRWPDGEEWWCQ